MNWSYGSAGRGMVNVELRSMKRKKFVRVEESEEG